MAIESPRLIQNTLFFKINTIFIVEPAYLNLFYVKISYKLSI
jgi:hypothetical protein